MNHETDNALAERLARIEVRVTQLLGVIRDLREQMHAGDETEQLAGGLGDLSRREMQVLERALRGQRSKELAQSLHLSRHTVRNHLKAIYRKLGVSSQLELIQRFGTPHHHSPSIYEFDNPDAYRRPDVAVAE